MTTPSILSLPFSILAALAPTRDDLTPRHAPPQTLYRITTAFIRLTRGVDYSKRGYPKDTFVTQDYNLTIHDVNPGNVDISCIGTLSWDLAIKYNPDVPFDPRGPKSLKLDCPQDDAGNVTVTTKPSRGDIYLSVQW